MGARRKQSFAQNKPSVIDGLMLVCYEVGAKKVKYAINSAGPKDSGVPTARLIYAIVISYCGL